jgi:hypothetical protein
LALLEIVSVPLLLVTAPATVMLCPVLIVNDLPELTVSVFAEKTPFVVVE